MSTKTDENTQDVLMDFLKYWLNNRDFSPPANAIVTYFHGKVVGSVLYRNRFFQVQLFTVAPNVEIPDHIHPNMDSFEVYVGGDIAFRVNGEYVKPSNHGMPGVTRIKPNDFHGGSFGKNGGLFLNVQHWLNGVEPSSAGEDWAFREDHEEDTNYSDESASIRFDQFLQSRLASHFRENGNPKVGKVG